MLGDVLQAISDRLSIELTADTLSDAYHAGRLSHFLPDGCCWLATIGGDTDDDLKSLEPIDLDHAQRIVTVVRPRPGALITRRALGDNVHITAAMFPHCEAEQQFQRSEIK